MFAIGLIVFREALEAALFIGIMAAATKGIPQRSRWLWLGLVLGVLGSVALAFGMGYINDWAQGTGQDWMQILILGLAFLMLTWHIVWSQKHGREMVQQARELGKSVQFGQKTLAAVAIAVSMIVMREGAETVLFVSGAMTANAPIPSNLPDATMSIAPAADASAATALPAQALDLTQGAKATSAALPASASDTVQNKAALSEVLDLTAASEAPSTGTSASSSAVQAPLPAELDLTQNGSASSPDVTAQTSPQNEVPHSASVASPSGGLDRSDVMIGGLVGLALGVLLGFLVYQGLSRISMKHLFAVTNGLVLLLAAGMASQIGRIFVQMGTLHSGLNPIWDSSDWISNDHPVGVALNALMGYDAQPSQTQVVFFVLGLLFILLMRQWAKHGQTQALLRGS